MVRQGRYGAKGTGQCRLGIASMKEQWLTSCVVLSLPDHRAKTLQEAPRTVRGHRQISSSTEPSFRGPPKRLPSRRAVRAAYGWDHARRWNETANPCRCTSSCHTRGAGTLEAKTTLLDVGWYASKAHGRDTTTQGAVLPIQRPLPGRMNSIPDGRGCGNRWLSHTSSKSKSECVSSSGSPTSPGQIPSWSTDGNSECRLASARFCLQSPDAHTLEYANCGEL